MNFSSLIGLALGGAVMYSALSGATDNLAMFLDQHSILIVLGGTLAAASISFPIKDVLMLVFVVFKRARWKRPNYQRVITQLIELNSRAGTSATALNESLPTLDHPFLKEAVQLVATGVLSESEMRDVLEQRLKTVEYRYMNEANMFRSIGRFPPAFGLLATTLGMISLLQKIGAPDSQKFIGPAMSIGLIGTLYGIALANLIFLPLAENLTILTQQEVTFRRLIVEGALMLKRQVNPVTMRENLNSFVLPRERVLKKAA